MHTASRKAGIYVTVDLQCETKAYTQQV